MLIIKSLIWGLIGLFMLVGMLSLVALGFWCISWLISRFGGWAIIGLIVAVLFAVFTGIGYKYETEKEFERNTTYRYGSPHYDPYIPSFVGMFNDAELDAKLLYEKTKIPKAQFENQYGTWSYEVDEKTGKMEVEKILSQYEEDYCLEKESKDNERD